MVELNIDSDKPLPGLRAREVVEVFERRQGIAEVARVKEDGRTFTSNFNAHPNPPHCQEISQPHVAA